MVSAVVDCEERVEAKHQSRLPQQVWVPPLISLNDLCVCVCVCCRYRVWIQVWKHWTEFMRLRKERKVAKLSAISHSTSLFLPQLCMCLLYSLYLSSLSVLRR